MCFKRFLTVYSLLSTYVDSTFVDQSQSGDLNVQVNLKGLHIIALMDAGRKEEYVDYDYVYDYSEMTIKPQNRTTPRPGNTSSTTVDSEVKDNVTIATTVVLETTTPTPALETVGVSLDPTTNYENSTIKNISFYNVTDSKVHMSGTTDQTTTYENSTIKNKISFFNVTDSPEHMRDTTESTNIITTPTKCKKGYVVNNKGDCEYKMQGSGNALLKLVQYSQQLKARRENKSDNADSQ